MNWNKIEKIKTENIKIFKKNHLNNENEKIIRFIDIFSFLNISLFIQNYIRTSCVDTLGHYQLWKATQFEGLKTLEGL